MSHAASAACDLLGSLATTLPMTESALRRKLDGIAEEILESLARFCR
jgi:hypothetical protein